MDKATTKTGAIVSAMIAANSNCVMYNDRLRNGVRSVKVIGWTRADYTTAQRQLEQAGCTVKVVKLKKVLPWARTQVAMRLHVTE